MQSILKCQLKQEDCAELSVHVAVYSKQQVQQMKKPTCRIQFSLHSIQLNVDEEA